MELLLGYQRVGRSAQNFMNELKLVCIINCILVQHFNCQIEQIQSFETELPVPQIVAEEGGPPSFRAVFIRAPAILDVGPDVEVLADIPLSAIETINSNPAIQKEEVYFCPSAHLES